MTHTHAKRSRSFNSKVRVETDKQIHGGDCIISHANVVRNNNAQFTPTLLMQQNCRVSSCQVMGHGTNTEMDRQTDRWIATLYNTCPYCGAGCTNKYSNIIIVISVYKSNTHAEINWPTTWRSLLAIKARFTKAIQGKTFAEIAFTCWMPFLMTAHCAQCTENHQQLCRWTCNAISCVTYQLPRTVEISWMCSGCMSRPMAKSTSSCWCFWSSLPRMMSA